LWSAGSEVDFGLLGWKSPRLLAFEQITEQKAKSQKLEELVASVVSQK